MPYVRTGALKVSDHHVRSPLLNVSNACQTCHKWPEAELVARAETIQQRTVDLRNRAMDALVGLVRDLEAARAGGASDAELAEARKAQRRGQFFLDFVESENSNGFHAPQESARILGEAIDLFRQGQIALRTPRWPASAAKRSADARPGGERSDVGRKTRSD
jgi:nitrite reductase (cytochrome c-552)